ncbi:MAG: phenylalanine--tRNA ligase subunit alpha [Elusimicrobiota bacterium]|jgi:phenylalanyl-tRNA synthetase alpha chain|nr:phenylalanine--tRNA ligase subunit alpha [Elusimicrobiota bacterium]
MKIDINEIINSAAGEIAAATLQTLPELKLKYLGKDGEITKILKTLKILKPDERKELGQKANEAKKIIEQALENKEKELSQKAIQEKTASQKVDISPIFYFPVNSGHFHIITKTIEDISQIFISLGFKIAKGPEIETDWYNFQALNHPEDHPARDVQDTFYLQGSKDLLRTHTSPVQVHVMQNQKPPVRVIVPGRVFRNEASDASHSSTFHQIEGLFVNQNVTFVDLKSTLASFVKKFFGQNISLRFRPSFFPFTEPSAEVDVQCFFCGGKGCGVCKQSGWIEILGCGMVHPNVFKAVEYDSENYTGFAFGMGVERIAMLKYGIDDIRLFYENDLRFLRQF